jgi:hypothetical protein
VVRALDGAADEAALGRALLSAGALECALEDAGKSDEAAVARPLTDAIAAAYLGRRARPPVDLAALQRCAGAGRLRVSRPEGFAYYGLVPRDLAERARTLELGSRVTVVGVRTIGTTLSAVVAAALDGPGQMVRRFTVRPHGHPYDRRTTLAPPLRDQVRNGQDHFLIVDEGPGLSGSSFLSVADALAAEGVAAQRIVFLGTRPVDPDTLVAPEGASRWRRYRAVAVPALARPEGSCDGAPGSELPAELGPDLSGGAWRAHLGLAPSRWPATWQGQERLKRLSTDGRWLYKFEGLGPYGQAVFERARALAGEGLAPPPAGPPDGRGFVAYPFPAGVPLARQRPDPPLTSLLGRQAALRAKLFPAGEVDLAAQDEMTRHNVSCELGLSLPPGWRLPCERAAIVDGRLAPHEFLRATEGALLKVDGASHGDDHLFPGPADVAWDLAGALVEWELDAERLVAAYRAVAGEDPSARLPAYRIAYAAFRARTCAMAAHGAPVDEAARLWAERQRYRTALRSALDGGITGLAPASDRTY